MKALLFMAFIINCCTSTNVASTKQVESNSIDMNDIVKENLDKNADNDIKSSNVDLDNSNEIIVNDKLKENLVENNLKENITKDNLKANIAKDNFKENKTTTKISNLDTNSNSQNSSAFSKSSFNYFQTQEYQDVAFVVQFFVYADADSKHFADMILKYNIFSIHENLVHLLNKHNLSISLLKSKAIKINKNFESELFQFVNDNFLDEDDNLNIPILEKVELPGHFEMLKDELKNVYMNIHKLWFKYARSDGKSEKGTWLSIENPDETLKIKYKLKQGTENFHADASQNGNLENDNLKNDNFESGASKKDTRDIKIDKSDKDKKTKSKNNNSKDKPNLNINTTSIKAPITNVEEQIRNESVKKEYHDSKIKLPSLYFVPGGRFKELYYWDSNWILIGLLHCNMKDYAFELTKTLCFLINKYGYIPNGTRKYYLGRSQPPVFAQMLYRLYKHKVHKEWILSEGLKALEKEYQWWMENRMSDFDKKNGLRLNRYNVHDVSTPRPESFKEDFSLHIDGIYKNLWSAAESGWDFSTRWFNGNGLDSIDVEDIIPVDLNVFLLFVEEIIIFFYNEKLKVFENSEMKDENFSNLEGDQKVDNLEKDSTLQNEKYDKNDLNLEKENKLNLENKLKAEKKSKSVKKLNMSNLREDNENFADYNFKDTKTNELVSKIKKYTAYRNKREHDINEILWNKSLKVWNDFNTKTKKHKNDKFYLSNIMPLFIRTKIPDTSINIYNILDLYKKELFGYPGGIPISGDGCASNCTPQQWDFPNVWAPLLQMFIEFVQTEEFSEFGTHVARSFYNSVSKGMGTNQEFHEKYDCRRVGLKGMGGEYAPQQGFGWTNGTVAWLIFVYGNQLVTGVDHLESYKKICEIIESRKK